MKKNTEINREIQNIKSFRFVINSRETGGV